MALVHIDYLKNAKIWRTTKVFLYFFEKTDPMFQLNLNKVSIHDAIFVTTIKC